MEISDQLLCGNGKVVVVKKIEEVCQSYRVYALSVEKIHTFCVGRAGIVVHNVEPVTTTAAVAAISLAFPPAGAALAGGEIIAAGVVGIGMYYLHKKLQKQQRHKDGCFSENNVLIDSGECAMPRLSVEKTPACSMPLHNRDEINEIIPYQKSDEKDVNCAFPIEVTESNNIQRHDTKKNEYEEKEQYAGPWYNRTEDWINEHPFGQKIKKSLDRSCYTNQGKRVFKVIANVDDCDGFKKGDYIVVDAMHKDHLEVFDKRAEWKQVANFDGTKNISKTKQGMKEPRIPLNKQG